MNEFDRGILRQLFIDALPDCAIIILDAEGEIVTWNAGARAILGYVPDEIIGRHFTSLYPKDHIAAGRPLAVLDEVRAQDRFEETGRLVRKDGSEVEAHSVIMPLYNRQKILMGFGILTRGPAISKSTIKDKPAELISRQPREQILVVDDDDNIRAVAQRQLASLGYRVIAAASGSEALEVLARVSNIDLLFTDVSMPGGMGGREVAEKAMQIRPGLKVLFASGYFEGALIGKGDLEADTQFLVKPYRKKDLAEKVREVLDGNASSGAVG